jgi:hypothetical protein
VREVLRVEHAVEDELARRVEDAGDDDLAEV